MALEFLNLRRGKLRRGITGLPDSPSANKQRTILGGTDGGGESHKESRHLLIDKSSSRDSNGSGSGKYNSNRKIDDMYNNEKPHGDSNITRQGSLKIPGGER